MKREIEADVYTATLEFLEDRVRIYDAFVEAGSTQKTIEKYERLRDDCEDIVGVFQNTYRPRKRRAAHNRTRSSGEPNA